MKKLVSLGAVAVMACSAFAGNSSKPDMWEHVKDNPELREGYLADKAGSLQKYLEMDKTPGRRIVWKYFEMKQGDKGDNIHLRIAADKIVTTLRKAKNGRDDEKGHTNVRIGAINDVAGLLKKGKATAEEVEAFSTEAARAKAEWLKSWNPGYAEPNAAAVAAGAKSAAEEKRCAAIVGANYLLGDLKDQDYNKRNVAKRKALFEKAIQDAHAPDKILGTYSTSRFWQGIPLALEPELKEKWSSLQVMSYKSYFQKGGKYYVVTGGFRQGVTHEDAKRGKGASEVKDYFPGIEAPIEVPANLIEKHFK